MQVRISNEISIKEPTKELLEWARMNLTFRNPEYTNKARRGLWTGNTPEFLSMYRVEADTLILPCGTGKRIRSFIHDSKSVHTDVADNGILVYSGKIPLYDYQETAVKVLYESGYGILQSPCGSGKTQMGIALAANISRKTLWVTHTQDLLNQSYERAAQYFSPELLGKISAGKVHVGSHMTFATIQTLSKIDLESYKYTWDVVIVDECHRLSGTPTSVTMFSKVMNRLAARYKYGLSATVHRADGLIGTTFSILGDIAYQVPDKAVEEKTMQVGILERNTGVTTNRCILDTDGTMCYQKLIPYLVENTNRNSLIVKDLIENSEHFNLILSDRLEHLSSLIRLLPESLKEQCVMIDGKMTSKKARQERARRLDDMRAGKKHYLFASYSLAKEGLDIPRLDRLYMALPKKDYAVVTQSIGRISRVADGKHDAICYDYVDEIQFCQNQFNRRKTSYRKARCRFL